MSHLEYLSEHQKWRYHGVLFTFLKKFSVFLIKIERPYWFLYGSFPMKIFGMDQSITEYLNYLNHPFFLLQANSHVSQNFNIPITRPSNEEVGAISEYIYTEKPW